MRRSRMKKFGKKNGKFIFASKILIMWYAILISGIILTSNTVAYYSTSSDVNSYISSAEDWWDKSELTFLGNGADVIQGCPPTKVFVEIKNIGLSMSKPTEFEIYYSEKNGNPSKNGEIISNGLIDPIEHNEISVLDYETEKEGWYIFKAYQRTGFKGNYDSRQEIWSNKIRLHCNEQQNKGEENSEVESIEKAADVNEEELNTQTSEKENNEEIIEERVNESNEQKSDEETNDNGTNIDINSNSNQKKTNQGDVQPEMPKEELPENKEIKSEVEKEPVVNTDSK